MEIVYPPVTIATLHDDGMQIPPSPKIEPGTTIIIGGCNLINANAHNVVQASGETIEAVAQLIQVLPPEMVKEISVPLSNLLASIAQAASKSN